MRGGFASAKSLAENLPSPKRRMATWPSLVCADTLSSTWAASPLATDTGGGFGERADGFAAGAAAAGSGADSTDAAVTAGISVAVSDSAVETGPVKAIARPWPTERRSGWASGLCVMDILVIRLPSSSISSNLIDSTSPPTLGVVTLDATETSRRSTTRRFGLGS